MSRLDLDSGDAGTTERGNSAQAGVEFACAVIIVGAHDPALVEELIAALVANPHWRAERAPLLMWHVDTSGDEPGASSREDGLTLSRLGFQALPQGVSLQPGAKYFVGPQQRVWFEGTLARCAPRSPTQQRPIDQLLLSLAEGWGNRSLCIFALGDAEDGECGLRILRAVGAHVRQHSAPRAKALHVPPLPAPVQLLPGPVKDLSIDAAAAAPQHLHPRAEVPTPNSEYPAGAGSDRRSSLRLVRVFSVPAHVLSAARLGCEVAVEKARERGRVRVWMPGCKAGGTTYAMAMLLSDAVVKTPTAPRLILFATDDDERALSIARAGRYPARAAIGMDPRLRGLYTFDEGELIRVAESLREVCVFSRHELLRDPPMARMDFVICHRIFEGLGVDRRAELIESFHYSIRRGGWLLAFDHINEFPDELFERVQGHLFRARPAATRWRLKRDATALGAEIELPNFRAESRRWRAEGMPAAASREAWPPESTLTGLALPLIMCDAQLDVVYLSRNAQVAFKLSAADAGYPLLALAGRLPGGLDLVHAAQISEAAFATSRCVVILFTDVTELEMAKAQAIADGHRQAAVARIGELASTLEPFRAVYDQALAALVGNISACSAGIIVEVTGHARPYEVVASRNLGADPLRTLTSLDSAGIIDAVVARGCIVSQSHERATLIDSESKGRVTARAQRVRVGLASGFACPIMSDGWVLGVVALFGRSSDVDDIQHRTFAQAIADLLGGALARQRARLRLTLERDVSRVIASASDLNDAGERLGRALGDLLSTSTVEIWAVHGEGSVEWFRAFPAGAASRPWPEGLITATSGPLLSQSGAETGELLVPVRAPDVPTHVLRLRGKEIRVSDLGLVQGFEHVGRMLGELLARLQSVERLRANEAAFRQRSAELEALYATLPVGISIHDSQGQVRHANEHVARVMDPPAPAGADPLQRLYAEEVPSWIARVLRLGESIHGVELFVDVREGLLCWLCNFGPIRDVHGNIHGASVVIQDITPLKRVEASLRQADQEKDDFLAMLGHELRNPMAAIRNATELLSRVEEKSPQLVRLQSIFDRQTLQTTKLIDGLLDIARVARGKVELQLEPVAVVALVRQVADDRRQQFNDRKLELRLPEDELWVMADRVRFVQILDNLISNALKFTLSGAHICIEVRRGETFSIEDPCVEPREDSVAGAQGSIEVRDDGMGIDPELLPRIFEPFRQGNLTRVQSQGLGLGLGLALVKGLAERHGFRLGAHSEGPGLGASFQIGFPVAAAPESPPPESRVDRGALDLLLVEGNSDISETLSELLQACGHRIQVVSSAEQALVALRRFKPDVVLCDIGLPGMDGLELAACLRADPEFRDLKLVAMTGFGDTASQTRIQRAGFDRQLIKPVQLEALQRCLARVAPRRRDAVRREDLDRV